MLTPHLSGDTSFSTNRAVHGSKRNAANNLLHGLRVAFGRLTGAQATPEIAGIPTSGQSPPPPLVGPVEDVIVFEDDARVACDVLEMFAASRQQMRAHAASHGAWVSPGQRELTTSDGVANGGASPRQQAAQLAGTMGLATTMVMHRPGLLTGTRDVDARLARAKPQPTALHRTLVVPRTIIKTFAWMIRCVCRPCACVCTRLAKFSPTHSRWRVTCMLLCRRDSFDVLEPAMAEMVAWVPQESPQRRLPPAMQNCPFCENYW